MRVTKWVNVDTDVEVEFCLSAEDIANSIIENQETGKLAVLAGLNRIAMFMRAIPDATLAELSDEHIGYIVDFLTEQRERYAAEGSTVKRLLARTDGKQEASQRII